MIPRTPDEYEEPMALPHLDLDPITCLFHGLRPRPPYLDPHARAYAPSAASSSSAGHIAALTAQVSRLESRQRELFHQMHTMTQDHERQRDTLSSVHSQKVAASALEFRLQLTETSARAESQQTALRSSLEEAVRANHALESVHQVTTDQLSRASLTSQNRACYVQAFARACESLRTQCYQLKQHNVSLKSQYQAQYRQNRILKDRLQDYPLLQARAARYRQRLNEFFQQNAQSRSKRR